MYSKKHIKKLLKIVQDKKYLVPVGFDSRSHNWIRKQYNGVGAEWMPKFIRQIMTWLLSRIEAAALVHDCEFAFTTKSYRRFTAANFRLAVNSAKSNRPIVGFACALLCQCFGWSAYRDGKESAAYCNFYAEDEQWNTSRR